MPPSTLQAQYPLSPRKFWKKMIPKIFPWVFIVLFILIGGIGLSSVARTPQEASDMKMVYSIISGLVTAVGILFLVSYAIYVRVYIRRYYYDANENFVTIKKGVFAPTEIHV